MENNGRKLANRIDKLLSEKNTLSLTEGLKVHPIVIPIVEMLKEQLGDEEAIKRLEAGDDDCIKTIFVADLMIKYAKTEEQKRKLREILASGKPLEQILDYGAVYLADNKRAAENQVLQSVSSKPEYLRKYILQCLKKGDAPKVYLSIDLLNEVQSKAEKKRIRRITRTAVDVVLLGAACLFGWYAFKHKGELVDKIVDKYYQAAPEAINDDSLAKLEKRAMLLDGISHSKKSEITALEKEIEKKISSGRSLEQELAQKKSKISELDKLVSSKTASALALYTQTKEKEAYFASIEKSIKEAEAQVSSLKGKKSEEESYTQKTAELRDKKKNEAAEFEKKISEYEKQTAKLSSLQSELEAKLKDKSKEYYAIGLEYQKLGKSDKAKEIFLKVVESDPKHLNANSALAAIYAGEKDYAKSKMYYEKAKAIMKENQHSIVPAGIMNLPTPK